MKTSYFWGLCLFLAFSMPALAQNSKKSEKAARLEEHFQTTLRLIESGQFHIEIDRVYPQSGHDVSRFNPSGYITITDTLAKGRLPFFGRAYSLPYGEGGGIEFDGPVRDRKMQIKQKRKTHFILYAFTVSGKNDIYEISLNIGPEGECTVNLISNNRTQISYSGRAEAIPADSPEKN